MVENGHDEVESSTQWRCITTLNKHTSRDRMCVVCNWLQYQIASNLCAKDIMNCGSHEVVVAKSTTIGSGHSTAKRGHESAKYTKHTRLRTFELWDWRICWSLKTRIISTKSYVWGHNNISMLWLHKKHTWASEAPYRLKHMICQDTIFGHPSRQDSQRPLTEQVWSWNTYIPTCQYIGGHVLVFDFTLLVNLILRTVSCILIQIHRNLADFQSTSVKTCSVLLPSQTWSPRSWVPSTLSICHQITCRNLQ